MLPAKSGTSGSCPWSSSFLTWSWSPRIAATCKGVSPRSLRCCLVLFLSSAGVGAAEHENGGKSDQPARHLKTLWWSTQNQTWWGVLWWYLHHQSQLLPLRHGRYDLGPWRAVRPAPGAPRPRRRWHALGITNILQIRRNYFTLRSYGVWQNLGSNAPIS